MAAAGALSAPSEDYGNDSRVEALWAMKAMEHAEVYFNVSCIYTWARGGVRGVDAHRLTPKNIVPLPKAKFDPLNREKMRFSIAHPSLLHQKHEKKVGHSIFSHFWKKKS